LCFIREFLCKMRPIQLTFLTFIVCRIFLSSLTLCNTPSFRIRSVQLIYNGYCIQNIKGVCVLNPQGGSNITGKNCDLFTHKSVQVIFEPPCTTT
jgi:hypothetical protein